MRSPRLLAFLLAAALGLAGCFNPKLEPGFTCGTIPPGPDCPDGFYCDSVTNTCFRNDMSPTPPGVALGPAYPGLVAARLGDGVAVAGWFVNAKQKREFQVRRFEQDGSEMFPMSPQPFFDGVDPDSLKAAGTEDIAVVVGTVPGSPDTLRRLWIWGANATIDSSDEGEVSASAVARSTGRACFVRAFPGPATLRGADLVCHDGTTPSAPWTVHETTLKPIKWVTAAVTDFPSENRLFAETDGFTDFGDRSNDILAFCAGHDQTEWFGRFKPQAAGDLGRPHATYSPSGTEVYIGLITYAGLETYTVGSTCTKTAVKTYAGTVKSYNVTAGSGSLVGNSVRGISLQGDPVAPAAQDWSLGASVAIRLEPEHTFYANPHVLTDSRNDFWFLFFASDGGGQQGWVKCASLSTIFDPVAAVGLDSGTFTSDFAATPRASGGFFLVARDNPDNVGDVSEALEARLFPVKPDLTVVTPSAP